MRWLKLYENFRERTDNPFYDLEPVTDEEGWETQQKVLTEPTLKQLEMFNNLYGVLGISVKDKSTSYLSTVDMANNMTLLMIEIGIDISKEGSIFHTIYQYEGKQQKVYVVNTDDKCVEKIEIRFNRNKTNVIKLGSAYNNRGIRFERPTYNVKLLDPNLVNVTTITILNDWFIHDNSLSDKIRLIGVDNTDYGNFVDNMLRTILSKVFTPNMTLEKIYNIVYQEFANSKDSHRLFGKLKGTVHYDYFRKIGGKNLDTASDMNQMGFND